MKLSLLPSWAPLAFLAAVVALLAGFHVYKVDQAESRGYEKGAAEVQAKWNAEKIDQIVAEQLKTAQILSTHKEIEDAAQRKIDHALALAHVADDANKRLRDRVAALTARGRKASNSTPTAESSPPAPEPIDLLADVHGRTDEAAEQFAEYADQLRIARDACESSYTLTP